MTKTAKNYEIKAGFSSEPFDVSSVRRYDVKMSADGLKLQLLLTAILRRQVGKSISPNNKCYDREQ
jgi:hypothetical protein